MLKIKSFVFSPVQENTYLLYNESNECIIIDPGCYFPEEKEEMRSFIEENGLHPKLLINTHCHLDHVFGNKFAADTYGLTLAIHEKEKAMLDIAPASGLMYNLPFDSYSGEIRYIHDGDFLGLGEDELEVIFAPGHSPGHICFYCARQHFIICGDVLFKRSIGRTDLPGGNYDVLISNIRKRLFTLPGTTIVYSGHGPTTTIAEEIKENPFLN